MQSAITIHRLAFKKVNKTCLVCITNGIWVTIYEYICAIELALTPE